MGGMMGGMGGMGANLVPDGIEGVLGYPLDNSLVVQGTPEAIEQLKRIIRLLDIPPRQIHIKVEQIAVTSTFFQQWGIDWQVTSPNIGITTGIGQSTGGAINVGILGDNWRVQFAAAVASGKAEVVESMSITTMNNVPATIFNTTTTYVFLPQIVQVPNAGVITQFFPQPLQALTNLTATPRINGDGTITMMIPFMLSRFLGESVGPDGARIPNQVMSFIQALRRVSSGQTIVVGGTLARTTSDSQSGIPILQDLPLIGQLFRSRLQNRSNTETLFFFTPTLLPDDVATGGPPLTQ
jgi:type II secretory pathway component GspD/PulD (secretin)